MVFWIKLNFIKIEDVPLTTIGQIQLMDAVSLIHILLFTIKLEFRNCLIEVPQKEYSITCRNSTECKASFFLVCSTSNNQCVCPNAFSEYRCDCPFSKYYDPTVGCRKFSQLKMNGKWTQLLLNLFYKKPEWRTDKRVEQHICAQVIPTWHVWATLVLVCLWTIGVDQLVV